MALPPLAELHRHLDGSLRSTTVEELAANEGVPVPAELAFRAGMGLGAALEKFAFTLSLLQTPHAVRRVASELCEDANAEGVTTLEVRFAPQLHLQQGARAGAIVDAALEGVNHRAGLLLCGLYGEPPSVLEELVELARTRKGVVGIDLAGGPAPTHSFSMASYEKAFWRARDLGLGRTVHAGEGRSVQEVRTAIEVLGAQRIGHGTTLLEDPEVVALVCERNVTIEACITSNWHVGAIESPAKHPLPVWLARGVSACICADNTLFSQTNCRKELALARSLPGMTDQLLSQAIAAGHRAAFVARQAVAP